jgi:hypothetical protein
MFSKIVCHYPFKQAEPQHFKLDLSIFNKKEVRNREREVAEEHYTFNEIELWNFIREFNEEEGWLDWS